MTIQDYQSIFSPDGLQWYVDRINALTPDAKASWGSMSAAQMLAHCSVAYEMVYTAKHKRPPAILRWILTATLKETVCGTKPYKKNSGTAPAFKQTVPKDFESEKQQLLDYLQRMFVDGPTYFRGRESNSFGVLTEQEWDTMMAKHLHHHLTQFGV
jgi:hypothetical protein